MNLFEVGLNNGKCFTVSVDDEFYTYNNDSIFTEYTLEDGKKIQIPSKSIVYVKEK